MLFLLRDTKYLSVFSPNAGKYGPEKTPYLDIFHAVNPNAFILLRLYYYKQLNQTSQNDKCPYISTFIKAIDRDYENRSYNMCKVI